MTTIKDLSLYRFYYNINTEHFYIELYRKKQKVHLLSTSGYNFLMDISSLNKKLESDDYKDVTNSGMQRSTKIQLYNTAVEENLIITDDNLLREHPVTPSKAFEWKVMATPREIHNKQQELLLIITI